MYRVIVMFSFVLFLFYPVSHSRAASEPVATDVESPVDSQVEVEKKKRKKVRFKQRRKAPGRASLYGDDEKWGGVALMTYERADELVAHGRSDTGKFLRNNLLGRQEFQSVYGYFFVRYADEDGPTYDAKKRESLVLLRKNFSIDDAIEPKFDLIKAKPGTYVFVAVITAWDKGGWQLKFGARGQCYPMDIVEFEVKPGRISFIGNFETRIDAEQNIHIERVSYDREVADIGRERYRNVRAYMDMTPLRSSGFDVELDPAFSDKFCQEIADDIASTIGK